MKKINIFFALSILMAIQLVAVAGGTWLNWNFNHGRNSNFAYGLTLVVALLLTLFVYFGFVRARLMNAPVSPPALSKLPGLAIWTLLILGGMFLLFMSAQSSVRLLWGRVTWEMLLMAIAASLYAAILEEIIFRDILVRWTLPHAGFIGTLFLQGTVFSAWHFFKGEFYLINAINWALAGILLTSIFIFTKNVYFSILVHFANNFCLILFNGAKTFRTYYPGVVVGEPSENQFLLIKTYQIIVLAVIFGMLWKDRRNKITLGS